MKNKKELSRLNTMKRYLQSYKAGESKLKDIVMLASYITGTPVSFITLMDKEIQWITTSYGYDVTQMPRSTSFCNHTIEQEDVLQVPDATKDERFKENPIVNATPGAMFYAGVPLKSNEGYNIGTLCVLDIKPNNINDEQKKCLIALSRQIANLMELDVSMGLLNNSIEKIEGQNTSLKEIAKIQAHHLRGPLSSAMGVMNVIKDNEYTAGKETLVMLEKSIHQLDQRICDAVILANKADYSLAATA
ncbi:hypothetical protein BH11BAC6_BH11BAC6_03230 [soil metagenome]